MRESFAFSQLIAPQGRGGTPMSSRSSIPTYRLYSPVRLEEPQEVPTGVNMLVANETLHSPDVKIQITESIEPAADQEMRMADPVALNRFVQPNKLEVRADAVDMARWDNLPIPTHFYVVNHTDTPEELPNEWDVWDGYFEATFYPHGWFEFTLSAEGFEDQYHIITATHVAEEDMPGYEGGA